MKLLIIATIVLAIPLFFLLVFVMSTFNKLTSLRNRCREIRERINATPTANSLTRPVLDRQTHGDFNLAAEHYNAVRSKFPANLLATLCGFHKMEPLPDQPVDGGREGLDKRAS